MNPTRHSKGSLLKAVQNSEAQYRRLFETAQDGILILDGSTGQITDANPFLLDMLGYTREQLVGRELWEIGFFKDRALSKAAFEKLHKEGYIRYACLPLKGKDGRGHEVEYVSNVYQVDHQPVIQCNIREITERQRATRELLESRETLQRVIDNIPQHVFWKDRNLNYLGANTVFARSAGLREPAEIIGKSDFDLSWKDSAEAYRADDRAVIESGVPKLNYEETQHRPDGSVFWLRTSKVPLVDDAGMVMGMLGIYEDITQRKLSEAALQQGELNLANAQRIAHLGSWEWHILENKLYWSDETCRIVGLPLKTSGVTLEGFLKIVHPADRAAVEKAVQESLAQKEPCNIEHRLVRPDGSERIVYEQGEVICDETGQPIRMVGTVLDITLRKQAEEALRASEEKFRRLFESSQDAIMTLEPPAWTFTSGNPAALKMFGATNEAEFISHKPWELSPDRQPDGRASAEKSKEMIETAVRNGSHFFEWTHCRISGEEFPSDVLMTRMEQGGKAVVQANVRDITKRKQAETALQQSEERFRILFEQAADSIFLLEITPEGIPVIRDANSATFRLLGYERDELLGQPVSFIEAAPNFSKAVEKRRRYILSGMGKTFEARHRCKDGTIRDFECSATEVQIGSKTFAISVERDISERIQSEARNREQAALLDKANDAIYVVALDHTILYWNRGAERTYGWTSAEALNRKTTELNFTDHAALEALNLVLFKQGGWSGERRQITKCGKMVEVFSRLTLVRNEQGQTQSVFVIDTDVTEKKQLEAQFLRAQRLESIGALASGIAHDLNNVLAPILIGAPLVQEMVTDATARRLLKTMETSAQRGAAIVRQVLTFARGVEGARAPLQPRHLLREMEEIAEETFPKSIRIESDVASDLWPVLGDSTQLHQALMNLCVNARDAMPGGGTLTFKAANVALSKEAAEKIPGAQPGSFACLSITDTGTGIPPEIQAKLFEPFFTTKGVGKGTGLGLSTTLGIVRSHGGFIRIASKVGQGTTFELYLPAAKGEQVAVKKDATPPGPRAHGECILVVDDEAAISEVVRQTLEAFGYQVITAGRGAEALRIFKERQQEIQLVLTDMMMPEMDGPSLVAALRVLKPAVRIVGITGMGDAAGLSGLKRLALSATLAKPFTIEEILTAVRQALPVTAGAERTVTDGGKSPPAPPG